MQHLTDLQVGSVLVLMQLACDFRDFGLRKQKRPEAELLGAICRLLSDGF